LAPTGETTLERCKERVQALESQLATGLSRDEDRIVRRWLVSVATKPEKHPSASKDGIR
jgi:hypothetical protein